MPSVWLSVNQTVLSFGLMSMPTELRTPTATTSRLLPSNAFILIIPPMPSFSNSATLVAGCTLYGWPSVM